ncbi:uridylate kinase [Methanofollis formosanus]|uniref:Uridylate kinase n=1 Tax=Methanofollis formosanus TaxID=299308 RepID=A0A8G1A1M5_9EURY|nr:uridylate kinase [Methanofollis formosanus]QYZ79415.1 uridylate kinase [Methanofollis formosanus]
MEPPVVVKMGGSLMDRAGQVVAEILAAGRPALLVPGGGDFADAVRALDPPATPAHWMAVSAMEMYGWYLSSFGLHPTGFLAVPDRPSVLLPYTLLRARDPLPHSWEVTSDTIAAWVAGELGLPLVLVKSVDGLRKNGTVLSEVSEPYLCEEVDPFLLPYLFEHHIGATIVNGRVPGRLAALLRGERVVCTRVHPSI